MQETISFTPQLGASAIAQWLWLIPAVPVLASGVIAVLTQPKRKTASTLAIGSLAFSLVLSLTAFAHVLSGWMHGQAVRETVNFTWIQVGASHVDLGWVLDPLSAIMLVMVTFVGLLIFIYSTGYMAHDANYMRFFCFLSLFAGAMLGVVIANSILLLFMCWELVGLTSYLLIGFWYQKPSAAAAAKKAFLTTRVGDVFFLLGIVWLFGQTGTLLFYNGGAGSMEATALTESVCNTVVGVWAFRGYGDWAADFCGSGGQERAVSAACVAAGCDGGADARLRADPCGDDGGGGCLSDCAGLSADAGMLPPVGGTTTALTVVTWVGAFTALFAALIAVAQNDIKQHPGLLDGVATGLHDGRPGHGRSGRGDVPPDYACVLQGAAVHGSGICDSWVP